MLDESKISLLLFDIVSTTYIPSWKDIIGKKGSKLRTIAELRAFYGKYNVLYSTAM